ncbi:YdaS family helix-turn-helix protein [Pseudomonas sp. CAN2814]|uniref:transcriptional regulator n=1 Tax=Pseudomonas sp. CAN1 TaxID=3046726 RepID=UPI002648D26C|nr:YdaS family helix-turn-helix protein [Pseudomonas sp. CAN1]MDN6857254.1 YdaS family helix-turn-helix protein [Pseudomonas sp. CAN1]
MTLLEFLKALGGDELQAFAESCSTSVGQLKQVAYGHRRANAQLAIAIDRHTSGQVSCEAVRPDIDWQYLRGSARAA